MQHTGPLHHFNEKFWKKSNIDSLMFPIPDGKVSRDLLARIKNSFLVSYECCSLVCLDMTQLECDKIKSKLKQLPLEQVANSCHRFVRSKKNRRRPYEEYRFAVSVFWLLGDSSSDFR